MRRRVLLVVLAMAPVAAAAQQIDLSSGGPIAITARDGFEWREAEQLVVASGDARAVRDNVTVIADRLVARYRKKAGNAPAEGTAQPGPGGGSGGNEIYRLEAEGNVRIFTPTDEAVGDRAVYDIDQAVMVMTGRALKLTTPTQVLTARDSLEYWSQKRMAVARGNAVAVTSDARRLAADVLVAYMEEDKPAPVRPAPPVSGGSEPPGAGSKLKRMEAYGNVEARTQTDIVRGDRGVYLPETGVARVIGNVRVTSGQNQINGPAADVNMRSGVARMLADPGARVQGVIMPNSTPTPAQPAPAQPGARR